MDHRGIVRSYSRTFITIETNMIYDEKIEGSILGGLLSSPQWFDQISADLQPQHFYDTDHRTIYEAMQNMQLKDMRIDRMSLQHVLGSKRLSEKVEELSYTYAFTSEILQHSKIVRELHGKRTLKSAANKIDAMLDSETQENLEDTIAKAQSIISDALSFDGNENHTRSYENILPKYLDMLQERIESEGNISGLSTGFRDLNEYTSGLFPHNLVIVAGRPAMGKTCAAINIAERATVSGNVHALIFSLEMKAEELIQRSVASLATINMGNLKKGELTEKEMNNLDDHFDRIKNTKITVNDMPDSTPAKIRAEAIKLSRELESRGEKLGLIIIDYLQLMSDTGFGPTDRTAEVSSISRKLKKLAGELDLPVIALSQLNRDVEKRPNKRPVISDLRESGALEQDADLILFLYRDEVYHPDSDKKGIAELIIGKQRSGPLGTVELKFEGQYSRFMDLPKPGEVNPIDPDADVPKTPAVSSIEGVEDLTEKLPF